MFALLENFKRDRGQQCNTLRSQEEEDGGIKLAGGHTTSVLAGRQRTKKGSGAWRRLDFGLWLDLGVDNKRCWCVVKVKALKQAVQRVRPVRTTLEVLCFFRIVE